MHKEPIDKFFEDAERHGELHAMAVKRRSEEDIVKKRAALLIMEIVDRFNAVLNVAEIRSDLLMKLYSQGIEAVSLSTRAAVAGIEKNDMDECNAQSQVVTERCNQSIKVQWAIIKERFGELIALKKKNPTLVRKVVDPVLKTFRYVETYRYRERGDDVPEVDVQEILDFAKLIEEFRELENGEEITSLRGKKKLHIVPFPGGMVVADGEVAKILPKRISLNETEIYKGRWDQLIAHPEGVIVRLGSKFLLNGHTLVLDFPCDKAWLTEKGIATAKTDNEYDEKGYLRNRSTVISVNGEKVGSVNSGETLVPDFRDIYKVVRYRKLKSYSPAVECNVYRGENENKVGKFEDDGYYRRSFVANGKDVFMRLDDPKDGKVKYVGLDPKYSWFNCGVEADHISLLPEGDFRKNGDKFYRNHRLVYEGPCDEFGFHRDGVLIRRDGCWYLYK